MPESSLPSEERFFSFEDSEKLKNSFLVACEVLKDYRFVILPTVEKYQPELYTDQYKPFVIGTCQDGSLLNLRTDWTVSLARFLSSIRHLELPVKVFYWGNVFSPMGDTEKFQMGIEHLGFSHVKSDAQVIEKLCEYLKKCSVNDFVVNLGHMGIVNRILEKYREREKIVKALFEKNFSELGKYPELVDLLYTQGGSQVIEEFVKRHPEFSKECEELLKVSEHLKDFSLTFDLSELRLQNYYTGIVFEIFHPNLGYPIAGGGRYDRLYSMFGKDIPAVGGAVYLDRLLEL
ncbi:MAG: ATP phosphoribosyltransferase regulatory subunit [Hydrogenobacter thermophilus]|nr:ATP phosphoribosyltransferase regulatory subunit [Hydrogenobacter thermophilus]